MTHEIVSHTSMCVPAARMFVVQAYKWQEHATIGISHDVYPVIALRTTVVHSYMSRSERPIAPTHDGLTKLGWHYDGENTETLPIFMASGEIEAFGEHSLNWYAECVVATWPESEDEQRLAPIIEDLRKEADKVGPWCSFG